MKRGYAYARSKIGMSAGEWVRFIPGSDASPQFGDPTGPQHTMVTLTSGDIERYIANGEWVALPDQCSQSARHAVTNGE